MGNNVFCTSLAGEELGRLYTWGTHPQPLRRLYAREPDRDLRHAAEPDGADPDRQRRPARRDGHVQLGVSVLEQDADGVTADVKDHVSGDTHKIRARYLIGADGGRSKVAEDIGLPMEGKMGVAGSMNIVFEADLSNYVAHRPERALLGDAAGLRRRRHRHGPRAHGAALARVADRLGLRHQRAAAVVDDRLATEIAHKLIGDDTVPIKIESASVWTVNDMYATANTRGRVFCVGDAVHRHPPSNGLGSNTSIQDAFNLAWKLALVLKGKASPALLASYEAERAPIAKQIVTRANQSIGEFGPIFEALGLLVDARTPSR